MTTVFDVAQYILDCRGPMTTMKLQKLVYYSQAWSTVWDDDVLFHESIEAWKMGPVVRALYERHRGQFRVANIDGGEGANLNVPQQETVDRVLDFYAAKTAQWLSDLTHMEDPWGAAWADPDSKEITPGMLAEYYGSLSPDGEKE